MISRGLCLFLLRVVRGLNRLVWDSYLRISVREVLGVGYRGIL